MVDNIFLQISVILGITVSVAFFMRLLRQPLVVAYIIAGLIAGPLFLNVVNGGEEFFETFAKFGIVLLLFIVGLSLNLEYIKKMGKSVLIGGVLQFSVTAVFGFIIMKLLGFAFIPSIFIAVAITFSSTIIVIKLLADKKDLEAVYGRYVVGLLVVQDIIAVAVMIFLNTSNAQNGGWYTTMLLTLGKGLLLCLGVFLLAKYLLPKLMDRVAQSGELLFIFTIAWCFGIASLVYWAGFSIEIGAIVAGISLGASVYQPEISSRMRPLRDFFIVLFFVVLGSELQLGDIHAAITPGIILATFVLIADPVILYLVMRKMGYTRRSAFLAGITAAQVSEFGFILIFKGEELGYLHGPELAILTVVALITIVISSYLITYNEQLYQKVLPFLVKFGKDKARKETGEEENYTVFVFGYHRIGWKVCEALAEKKISFAVVDYNPDAISKLKHRGIPAFFGDAADVEFLESLTLEKAKLIISTIPEADDQKTMIQHVRKTNKKSIIIANLYHNTYLDDLYEAGVNYVMMPHLLGGQWVSEILKDHPWTQKTFKDLKHEQKEEMKLRFTAGTDII
ncbi:hypothetical protein C0581_02750 [Candidatus Parcubacteria bacterium]|nr:MAG: hypothetical protein C0581_02750 [Candidatus Parcubacteria bacterium]